MFLKILQLFVLPIAMNSVQFESLEDREQEEETEKRCSYS